MAASVPGLPKRMSAAMVLAGLALGCGETKGDADNERAARPEGKESMTQQAKVTKSDAEWKSILTPEQYEVLRRKGTEEPFTGAYWDEKEPGTYLCAGCGAVLFSSEHKYDSGSGWPSFWQPLRDGGVVAASDNSAGMARTEVLCAVCGGHLGHVFEDGPEPTGLRYCVNSAALKLDPAPEK